MIKAKNMCLETKHAVEIIRTLENARDKGLPYVVFGMQPMDIALHPGQFDFFKTEDEALDYWELKAGGGYLPGDADFPVYYRRVDQMLDEIKQANSLTEKENISTKKGGTIALREAEHAPRKHRKGRRI
jgi:hypothetical protein